MFDYSGKTLMVIGGVNDTIKLYTATNKYKAGAEITGGWAGAMVAERAYAWGVTAFVPLPVKANPYGAAAIGIGGLVVGIVGYGYGSYTGAQLYEFSEGWE